MMGAYGETNERGSVLIIVMWISLGLVSIVLLFGNSMMLEYRGANNIVTGHEAAQAIAGGRRYLAYTLENLEAEGQMPNIEEGEYSAEGVALGVATFWVVGRDVDDLVGEETLTFGLVDEAAKLNLNTATVAMLEALPYMPAEFAAAIVDWRDEDDDLTTNGAESSDYLSLEPGYAAKNADFETVDELRLVYGADWALLYGEDLNQNGVLDPNEDDGDESLPPDDGDGELDAGFVEYLTVYSREPDDDPQSAGGLVNVNHAPAEVLACIPGIGEENAESIIAYRQGKTEDDLGSVDWIGEVLSGEGAVQATPFLTTSTYQYAADIVAVGRGGRGFRRERIVFDLSEGDLKIVHRRDMTRLGWPLGSSIREELQNTAGELMR